MPLSQDEPYTIMEDLKLLYQVYSFKSTLEENLDNILRNIENDKQINRTIESMRERFDLLRFLTLEDIKNMYSYLRHSENEKPTFVKLSKLIDSDKVEMTFIVEENKMEEDLNTLKQKNPSKIHQKSEHANHSKKIHQIENYIKRNSKDCYVCLKYEKILSFFQDPRLLQHEQEEMFNEDFKKIEITRNFETNQRTVGTSLDPELVLLKEVMEFLMEKYQKTMAELLTICEEVSGGFADVEEYLMCDDEEKRNLLVWDKCEDEILEQVQKVDDIRLKMLIRYKGLNKVKSRIKFRGIKHPFNL